MLVLVAPGQGSQAPGFLNPWLDLPGVADRLEGWSDLVGADLVHLGTKADAEEIRDTAVAQPLLVAAALLSAAALFDGKEGDNGGGEGKAARGAVGAVAGHSVGELAAAAIAGVITEDTAMTLVRSRATAMAEAAAAAETGMSAVLGGDPDEVAARLAELELVAANDNGGGQIVAAGTLERLAELSANRPEKARVVPLKVAGAFHTAHMAPAVAAMERATSGIEPGDPGIRYVSNADGSVVTEGREVVRRLVTQVSSPVRWDLCTETFRRLGVTAFVELCPAGTLTALAKRNLPGVDRVAVKGPEHLAAARELFTTHAAESADAAPAAEQEH
ncbi:ACP S-malonyltransferase [Streptomyces sp. PT12]|uniref:ACP S-malonyltransferase n=1 Tax=Streptomyces sp. PT12 TaxID=1510197 RepID=UPI000DE28A9A|nr:ACP S-malonyltransferase [Streptomyces sp. PT12]RBM18997.1 ACP S-malonyltransferase [Streptomyces sp. PT12]